MELESVLDETFVVNKQLGSGYTSTVYLATHKETGYKLAIKVFKPQKSYKMMHDTFLKEVNSMKNLKHDNLVNIIAANESGVFIQPGKPKQNVMYLGLELAQNGELFDFIADVGKGFTEDFARHYFKELILGLKAMHDQGLAHRDLKTENLFLDDKFTLKIGDFGFAKFMDPTQFEGKLKTRLGTEGYQCPELVEGSFYSGEANDIFACGVILFILLNAYPPFREGKKTDTWYRHIYYGKPETFWSLHSKRNKNLSSEVKDLLTGMLNYKNRLTITEILNHKWLQGAMPSKDGLHNEMAMRKSVVDSRKERELKEKVELENQSSGGKVYRGQDEDVIVEEIMKTLEQHGVEEFPTNEWLNLERRGNVLCFNGVKMLDAYRNVITALVDKKAEVEVSEEEYSLTARIEIEHVDEETKEKSTETVELRVNLYSDYTNETTVAEFLKGPNTNKFSFREVFEQIRGRFSGE